MCGDIAVNQAATAVLDHDEDVEPAESGGDDDGEITSDDSLSVQAQEC